MKNLFLRLSILSLFIVSACFFTGCQPATDQKPASEAPKTQTSGAPGEVRVEIKTEPELVEGGKPVTIALTLKNEKDAVIKDLKIAHEKLLHMLVISDDLQEFAHLHPDQGADGTFIVQHTFPSGGKYKVYLDMVTADGKQVVKTVGMGVAGTERPAATFKADSPLVKTVDGLKVEMKPDAELTAKKDVNLRFTLTDAASGKAPTDMQKYLGEDAHFVIVSQDMNEFVHAHPMGHEATPAHAHHVEGHEDSHGDAKGKEIAAHVSFPKGGLYKIWAQFQRAGKIITVPFVVNVKGADGEADYSKVEIPAGAIKVTVSKTGYTPNMIEVKAGKPATLAFIRVDEQNCGQELVFPSLNIKKDLPLGKVVTVDIPAEKPGDFSFACGMNMLKGQVIVD